MELGAVPSGETFFSIPDGGTKLNTMSRTYRKRKGIVYSNGRLHKGVPHKCRCEYCTTRRSKIKEKIVDREMKSQVNYPFEQGWWYEGMESEELLENYWNEQWRLDKISRNNRSIAQEVRAQC